MCKNDFLNKKIWTGFKTVLTSHYTVETLREITLLCTDKRLNLVSRNSFTLVV